MELLQSCDKPLVLYGVVSSMVMETIALMVVVTTVSIMSEKRKLLNSTVKFQLYACCWLSVCPSHHAIGRYTQFSNPITQHWPNDQYQLLSWVVHAIDAVRPLLWGWLINICWLHIDGLVQERCNSIANALELQQSCTKPSIRSHNTCYIARTSYYDNFNALPSWICWQNPFVGSDEQWSAESLCVWLIMSMAFWCQNDFGSLNLLSSELKCT